MRAFPLLGFALLLTTGEGRAQDPITILTRASERYESLSGFCADFRMSLNATVMRRIVNSAGELCRTNTDLFDMRFSDPAGDRYVADGTYIWSYTPSIDPEQVDRVRITAGTSGFDDHREFLSNPGTRYAPTLLRRETVVGRDCHVIRLVPRTPSANYLSATVWIDSADYLIRKIEIEEVSENVRTMEFTAIRLNPSLPASRFHFDPPDGAQVITR